jgi:hypothetical protein
LQLEEEELEPAQATLLLQALVEQGLFVVHLGVMEEQMAADALQEHLGDVLVELHQPMVQVEQVADCLVVVELQVQVVVFLVKPDLWDLEEMVEPRHTVLEEVEEDFMAVVRVCRVVAGVMAAAAADLHMRIKPLHQHLLTLEEIIIRMVIVQLHGPVQDVALLCFLSQ